MVNATNIIVVIFLKQHLRCRMNLTIINWKSMVMVKRKCIKLFSEFGF